MNHRDDPGFMRFFNPTDRLCTTHGIGRDQQQPRLYIGGNRECADGKDQGRAGDDGPNHRDGFR